MFGRNEQLLLEILKDGSSHSAQSLANALGVSSKTVRSRLAMLNQQLKDSGIEIISSPGTGYRLLSADDNVLNALINLNTPGEFNSTVANQDRANVLLHYLLSEDDYVSIETLSSRFYVSVSTIKKNLIYVRDILKRFNLQLVSRRTRGIRVDGSEHDLRMCTNYILNLQRRYRSEDIPQGLDSLVDSVTVRSVENVIYPIVKTVGKVHYSFNSIHFMAKLIVVSDIRNRMGHRLQAYDDNTISIYTSRDSYVIAKRILKGCEEVLDTEFTAEDEILMAICLVALRVFVHPQDFYKAEYMHLKNMAFDVVEYIGEINHMQALFTDGRIVDDLALRMESLIACSRYHINKERVSFYRENMPILPKKLALQASAYLYDKYSMAFSDEGIGILTMLFHQFLAFSSVSSRKLKACVVNLYDYLVAYNDAEEIRLHLEDIIDRIDVIDYLDFLREDRKDYDIILTNSSVASRLTEMGYRPVFTINSYYPGKVIAQVREWYSGNVMGLNVQELLGNLSIEHIDSDGHEQCLSAIAETLATDGGSARETKEDLVRAVTMFSENPVNNTAFISGLWHHQSHLTVRLFVLSKPITWFEREQKVQLIVYWDSGETEKDIEYSRNEYFTRMIQELFSDRELVNEIIETGGISQLEEKADLLNSKLIRSVHRHFVR